MTARASFARRRVLAALGAGLAVSRARSAPAADESFYPPVVPGVPLAFPRDHGAHPDYRTEWWYLTGWLRRLDGARRGEPLGVQVTFFRSRTRHAADNPSRFAPTQLLLAHAALAVPGRGRLVHAQRAARAGFGLASAATHDTAVGIGGWSLSRSTDDRYRARVDDRELAVTLELAPQTAPVAQGDRGFSRKGPRATQASYYYSRPQLPATGTIVLGDETVRVAGVAWLDHEWSSEILDASSDGWDWTGLNFDDGSALVAFRIRRRDGGVLWSHARWIDTGGAASAAPSGRDVAPRFVATRNWTSPRTGARYPVAMTISIGTRTLALEPLFDDQELDARASTGTVYWEGAVRAIEAGREVGRGYLELTGYAGALRM